MFSATTPFAVDPRACDNASYIIMSASYLGAGSNDLNNNGIPDDCECPADINFDGVVNIGDLLELLSEWGPCE